MKQLLITAALLASSVATSGQSSPPAAQDAALQPSLAGATSVVYKRASGVELKLWVFSPTDREASSARPAIVFFGGGGWTTQNPAQFSPQARYFATKGLVAVVADYRVRSVNQTTPYESVADAKSAVRWLRENATELHIDPTRLAAGGGSAGGHIALTAALLDAFDEPGENGSVSSKPNALVLFNPVPNTAPDPQAGLSPQQQAIVAWLGSRAREISPIDHLGKNLPPTIIFHGKADRAVPFSEVEAFCHKAVGLGNRCELVAFEGASHGFFNPPGPFGAAASPKWYYETLSKAEAFLKSLGYIR
jgi:acetyl esterase/lipase